MFFETLFIPLVLKWKRKKTVLVQLILIYLSLFIADKIYQCNIIRGPNLIFFTRAMLSYERPCLHPTVDNYCNKLTVYMRHNNLNILFIKYTRIIVIDTPKPSQVIYFDGFLKSISLIEKKLFIPNGLCGELVRQSKCEIQNRTGENCCLDSNLALNCLATVSHIERCWFF